MEEVIRKETIEGLERLIRNYEHEIEHTESLIYTPRFRGEIRTIQNALNMIREAQETIRGVSNPSKDIFILKGNNKLEMAFFIDKLKEETEEVIKAFLNKDDDNFLEEVLDVQQIVVDILAKLEMNEPDTKKAIEMHNAKIKSRGFELEYPAISFNMME